MHKSYTRAPCTPGTKQRTLFSYSRTKAARATKPLSCPHLFRSLRTKEAHRARPVLDVATERIVGGGSGMSGKPIRFQYGLLSLVAFVATALVACSPAAAPSPTAKPAEKAAAPAEAAKPADAKPAEKAAAPA